MEEQKSYNIIGSANIATTELIPSSDTSEVPILADKIVNIFVTLEPIIYEELSLKIPY